MSKQRNILLGTLYLADEDIVSKELILYLDENVSREEAVTPQSLMSHCFMFWAVSPKREPSNKEIDSVKDNLTKALKFVWQHGEGYRNRVAELQRNRMRGWRISNSHRLRKIAKAFDVPVK